MNNTIKLMGTSRKSAVRIDEIKREAQEGRNVLSEEFQRRSEELAALFKLELNNCFDALAKAVDMDREELKHWNIDVSYFNNHGENRPAEQARPGAC